ncbi:hypothetical protein [Aliivibrio logei]|uniref:Uncharacterized protein n=1 Tax=Aliivibrio logei 5S-186 TaxID=626086 RepID=A0ABX3AX33_ALILO|nr:hypothetical protein [Aliivibrio logei]OEF18991.1 hypothetical protein A1Q5_18565 [Aliivibrio logei 5S-186]
MAQVEFGHQNKLIFNSESDMYESIGFLATSQRTSLTWEHNETSGAWGSEGRIHCNSDLLSFPAPLQAKFTAGVGATILKRINCNEFIEFLANTHGFQLNNSHSVNSVRSTIPAGYLADFDRGVAI